MTESQVFSENPSGAVGSGQAAWDVLPQSQKDEILLGIQAERDAELNLPGSPMAENKRPCLGMDATKPGLPCRWVYASVPIPTCDTCGLEPLEVHYTAGKASDIQNPTSVPIQ